MLKPLCSILPLFILSACASSRNRAARNMNGTYAFTERVSQAIPPVVLEGFVTVAGREVEVQMRGINCRLDDRTSRSTAVFDCEDATIAVDRTSPLTQTSYTVETTRRRQVRECQIYSTTATGDRVCIRWGTRYEEYLGTLSGRLRLVLIPG